MAASPSSPDSARASGAKSFTIASSPAATLSERLQMETSVTLADDRLRGERMCDAHFKQLTCYVWGLLSMHARVCRWLRNVAQNACKCAPEQRYIGVLDENSGPEQGQADWLRHKARRY